MKLIITDSNHIVQDVADTNLADPSELGVIEVGGDNKYLVADNAALPNIGDTYTGQQ